MAILQSTNHDHSHYLPDGLPPLANAQTALPLIAKDPKLIAEIDGAISRMPTWHKVIIGDSRQMSLVPASVHLVLTSPPYWTLKEYQSNDGQLGHVANYDNFLDELDKVWKQCYSALVPGGRMVCVVGDVCLSRRKNER